MPHQEGSAPNDDQHHLTPMSVQAMSWVFDHSETELATRLVLLSIANHANAEGIESFPGQKKIAAEAHVSVRTVRRSVELAVEMGELCVGVHQGKPGLGGRTNYYSMTGFRAYLGLRSDCPHLNGKCGHPDMEVRTSDPGVRSPVAAEPSLEPSTKTAGDPVLSREQIAAHLKRARADLRPS